jgi:glutamyl-tRNA synthetase
MTTVRTRFAPSPTGYLHIGSVRTALYCYLFARKNNGKFILRIEDTDLERSSLECVDAILQGMEWVGLDYDEGPFYQTQRFDRYKQVIQQLLNQNKAYKCYCSKEKLEKLRAEQLANKQKPRYNGCCRDLPPDINNNNYVIRFKNPDSGEVQFNDCVHGVLTFQNHELDDLIIARSDGSPTYNFTVVVDDWDMQITHVIRGDDHINNTPRQINILKALGANIPIYAHLPMILGHDGKRLSKRHGSVNIMEYRDQGILPEALLNYLVRLGWSHGDQEIFSRKEMIEYFDLDHLTKSSGMFNPEKLSWLNQHYLKTLDPNLLSPLLNQQFQKLNINIHNNNLLMNIIKLQAERCKNLKEMAEKSIYFCADITEYNPELMQKHFTMENKNIFIEIISALENIDISDWKAGIIHPVILALAEKMQLKLGKIAQPIRVAVTNSTATPPLDITLELINKPQSLRRLKNALALCA